MFFFFSNYLCIFYLGGMGVGFVSNLFSDLVGTLIYIYLKINFMSTKISYFLMAVFSDFLRMESLNILSAICFIILY